MNVEGELSPRFQAFTLNISGEVYECVFTCNDLLQLQEFTRRADKRYKWRVDGLWMSSSEFDEWRTRQSALSG